MKIINLKVFIICIIWLFVIKSNAQVVTTYAGAVSGSTDGPISSASFTNPHGIYINPTGDIYIADEGNHKIRKISSAGVVSTFAGSGVMGSANGTGTGATFNKPRGICADASGNLYIADSFNHKIRKITPAGVVTNFAGSGITGSTDATGTAASFFGPRGICIDASGNIYVADEGNNKIRKITPAGVVTTFAGTGTPGAVDGPVATASFSVPQGICIDGSGNFYVADRNNNLIRKISSTGVVSTLAGSGTAGFVDGTGAAASFNKPVSVYANSIGDIFVSDQSSHSIRKVTPTGVVTTIAGSGVIGSTNGTGAAASFNFPAGLCSNSSGDIFVADLGSHKIRKISMCVAPLAPTNTTAQGNPVICANTTTSLSVTSAGTVEWYTTPLSTSSVGSGLNFTTPVLAPGTYTYYAEATTCTTGVARTEIIVTVNPAITGSQTLTLCAGQSVTVGSNSYNASGVYTDVLTAANGCDSTITTNLTVNPAITGSQTLTLCAGQSITVGSNTYNTSGVFTDVLAASNGCDSTVTTNLTVENTIDISTSTSSETITSNATSATYQWIDCGNSNQPIVGETNQSFTAIANGNYAVIVTQNACSDTSACVNISTVGIKEVNNSTNIKLYPNPTNGSFTISGIETNSTISIYNAIGELIKSIQSTNNNTTTDLSECSSGIYFVRIKNNKEEAILKITKQ